MTESEWNDATDPQEMLTFLRAMGTLSERKQRLFAVACCRRVWHFLTDERCRVAVEVTERFVEGLAAKQELTKTAESAGASATVKIGFRDSVVLTRDYWGSYLANYGGMAAALATTGAPEASKGAANAAGVGLAAETLGRGSREVVQVTYAQERAAQTRLLRDIFGPPFAVPPRIEVVWLTWNDGTIKQLAEAAYEHRTLPSGHLDSDRLAVLADALKEVGCTDTSLLAHLRQPTVHVRGCFALDAVMGMSLAISRRVKRKGTAWKARADATPSPVGLSRCGSRYQGLTTNTRT